jgi:hypothetical protein
MIVENIVQQDSMVNEPHEPKHSSTPRKTNHQVEESFGQSKKRKETPKKK